MKNSKSAKELEKYKRETFKEIVKIGREIINKLGHDIEIVYKID